MDVERLVVCPSRARRGIGRALMSGVLVEAARSGREVVVSTADANAPALALYSALGFTVETTREVEAGVGVTDLRWRYAAAPG